MSKRRVIVIGKGGMLGHQVCRMVTPDLAFGSSQFDFTNQDEIEEFTTYLKREDIVINCVGMLRQAMSPQPTPYEIWKAFMLNSYLPHRLAEVCRLVHISTDCVFQGTRGSYSELCLPDGKDVYARTKVIGEPTENALVLRTSIIGRELKAYLGLVEWFMKQKEATGFTNHQWNGLTTNELARCISILISRDEFDVGLFHLHGEPVSKYEILKEVNRYRREPARVIPTQGETGVNRTLSTVKPSFMAQFGIRSFRSQIKQMMESA